MTKKQKQIKKLVKEMLANSHKEMISKIDKALTCGALDVESWDESNAPMVIPKTIVAAILQNESRQYFGQRTKYQRQVKKDCTNLNYFL